MTHYDVKRTVSSELNKHALLREKLIVEFPSADEETLADTLDGLTELSEVIAELLRSGLEDLALAKGLKGRVTEMQERLERFEIRAEKKRNLCLDAMERANIKKIAEPDFTASLRSKPVPLIITDVEQIPTMYFKPQPAKLDRGKLHDALARGEIPGAVLGNPARTISIRTK